MKEYSKEELTEIYKSRCLKLADFLVKENLGAAVFIDNEAHRDPAIRYYTGHTSDAVLIILTDGYTVLVPWDENLAKQNGIFDKLIPFTRYKNNDLDATKAVLNSYKAHQISDKVDLPPYLSYPTYLKFVDGLSAYQCRCSEHGSFEVAVESRLLKDEYEIECTKEACRIGDLIVTEIEKQISSGQIKTETDVSLLIEKMLRENNCERTGFDTLAAGPARSFAIHAFPGYTNAPWPAQGLSILDFGVVYKGYTSDQTITIAKGPLTPEQEAQIDLVQKAFDECVKLYTPEHTIFEAAKHADNVFAKAKRKMPHTLGHGIGLEIHEYPRVSTKTDAELHFKPGMILTCEPGLYDPEIGGCRLENDVLITENGNEILTNSRIFRI